MNRMEVFAELKKDPTKIFRLENYEYFVENDVLKIREIGCETSEQITTLFFEDNREYYEVEKPFRDRIKRGDTYYIFNSKLQIELEEYKMMKTDDVYRKNGNFFETREECEEAIKKIKEMLRG